MAVVVNVVGNWDGREIARAQRELAKLTGQTKKNSSSFKSSMGAMGKSLIGLAAGGVALTALKNGFMALAQEATDSINVGRTTEAIIKSTGGAAKVSAEQVNALATSLSNKTGIDDEAIQTSSNLLLTFKNVRNEVGKGNKIFDRATAAALDLSKAGFGSTESAAKMLGKALNDPIKGVTALSRAGVTFSDQQKKQIKTLVESGKTLEAQKLIMAEVESQVGGVAAATANPIERIQTMIGNFQESIGAKLLPILQTLLDAIGPILDKIAGPLGDVLATLASTLVSAFEQVAPVLQPIAKAFTAIAQVVGAVLGSVLKALVPVLMPILNIFAELITSIAPVLQPILQKVAELFGRILQAIAPLIPPLVKVVQQIFTAAAPIIDAVIDVLLSLVKAFAPLIPVLAKLLPPLTRLVMAVLKAIMPIITPLLPLITGLAELLATHLAGAVTFLTDGLNTLLPYFEKAVKWISKFGSNITTYFGDLGTKALEIGKAIVEGIWNGIQGATDWLKSKVTEWASAPVDWVKEKLGIASPSKVFMSIGEYISQGMAAGIAKAAGSVQKAAVEMSQGAIDGANSALSKFKDRAKAFLDLRSQVAESMRNFGSIGGVPTDGAGFGVSASSISGYLAEKLSSIRKFGSRIEELRKMNLNNATLQEIISAGPDAGSQLAAALIAEGKSAVSDVNRLQKQIASASAGVGTTSASSEFGMSLREARGINSTTVTIKDGAVVLNFGDGTSKSDAAQIKRAVEDGIREALKKVAKDAKR